MLPDQVSNPGPLTYESGALPIALRGPAIQADLYNIEETNEGPCRSKRLAFSLPSNLRYEYETNMFSSLPIHSISKSRKKTPQKLTQLSSRSHPRHLVGKRTAQKRHHHRHHKRLPGEQQFPYRWSPASPTFNNYFYLFLYSYKVYIMNLTFTLATCLAYIKCIAM